MNHNIDEILSEWAIRSPDGLAAGHTYPGNIKIMIELLAERGWKESTIEKFINEIVSEPTSTEPSVSQQTLTYKLHKEKAIQPVFSEKMDKIIEKYPEFSSLYDSCATIDQAVGVYNDPGFRPVIDSLNGITHRGLGPGELGLVFLIRGCKSGGSKSGDLVMADGTIIDVKAYDVSHDIRMEPNSFNNFRGLKFNVALNELITYLRGEPEAASIISSIIKDDTLGPRAASPNEKKFVEKFVTELTSDEMGGSTFTGLMLVGNRLNRMKDSKTNYIELNVDKKKYSFVISDPERDIPALANLTSPKKVSLSLAPVEDMKNQIIIPKLKELKYFKNEYGPADITHELLADMKYDEFIVVDSHGHGAIYIPQRNLSEKLKFSRFSKGIKLKVNI